jgi:hypothetical protein
MRIAIGQLWQETNTFNPIATTREDFETFGVLRGAALVERMSATNELGGFIQALGQWPEQTEIVGLARLPAWPGGAATQATFTWLRGVFIEEIKRALPVDGERGARVLRRILVDGARPVTAFVKLPMVVPAERANTTLRASAGGSACASRSWSPTRAASVPGWPRSNPGSISRSSAVPW